jgi:hypothetical protein
MTLWKFLLMVLLIGVFCVTVTVVLLAFIHSVAWIFNLGRKTARRKARGV